MLYTRLYPYVLLGVHDYTLNQCTSVRLLIKNTNHVVYTDVPVHGPVSWEGRFTGYMLTRYILATFALCYYLRVVTLCKGAGHLCHISAGHLCHISTEHPPPH